MSQLKDTNIKCLMQEGHFYWPPLWPGKFHALMDNAFSVLGIAVQTCHTMAGPSIIAKLLTTQYVNKLINLSTLTDENVPKPSSTFTRFYRLNAADFE